MNLKSSLRPLGNRRMRLLVSSAVVGSVLAAAMGPSTIANAADGLPDEGSVCSSKQFDSAIPVRKKLNRKSGQLRLVKASSVKEATGSLVCRSASWSSDEWKAFVARFGEWIYVPLDLDPVFPRIDPSRFQVSPATVPCRLRYAVDGPNADLWETSLSWSRETRAADFVATDRRARALVVHLTDDPELDREEDSPEFADFNRAIRSAANEADDYWQAQSGGQFGVSVDIAPGVHYVERPERSGTSRPYVLRDQLQSLNNRIDFAPYDVVVATRQEIPGTNAAGEVVFIPPIVEGNPDDDVLMMIDRDFTDSLPFLFKHEFAHTFGLPDLYGTNGNARPTRFVGGAALMGKGSSYLTAYERWILGWVPDDAVLCVSKEEAGEIELTELGDGAGKPTMAIFPTSPTKAVVVEYRDEQLPSTEAEGPHLFVYWVNAASQSALSSGTGAEDQNIFSMRGAQDTPRTTTQHYREHQAEPPMVTYRKDMEQLRRIPGYSAESGQSYQEYLDAIDVGSRARGENDDPFLAPGSEDSIREPWFGLTIPQPPRLSTTADGSQGLTFAWRMNR